MTPDELVDRLIASGAFGGRIAQENPPEPAESPTPPCPGGVVHTAWAKAWDMARTLPALERQAFAESLGALETLEEAERKATFTALYKVLYARFRGRRIARNDKSRRTIIGARVNREFAEICKYAAESAGLSTTQWCYRALCAALAAGTPADPDSNEPGPAAWLL